LPSSDAKSLKYFQVNVCTPAVNGAEKLASTGVLEINGIATYGSPSTTKKIQQQQQQQQQPKSSTITTINQSIDQFLHLRRRHVHECVDQHCR
jgi:hypothetical protein